MCRVLLRSGTFGAADKRRWQNRAQCSLARCSLTTPARWRVRAGLVWRLQFSKNCLRLTNRHLCLASLAITAQKHSAPSASRFRPGLRRPNVSDQALFKEPHFDDAIVLTSDLQKGDSTSTSEAGSFHLPHPNLPPQPTIDSTANLIKLPSCRKNNITASPLTILARQSPSNRPP